MTEIKNRGALSRRREGAIPRWEEHFRAKGTRELTQVYLRRGGPAANPERAGVAPCGPSAGSSAAVPSAQPRRRASTTLLSCPIRASTRANRAASGTSIVSRMWASEVSRSV